MSITTMLSDFHFIRPLWLLALVPAAALGYLLIKNCGSNANAEWTRLVDKHLLKQLTVGASATKRSHTVPLIAAVIVVTGIVGSAGPTWQEADVPSFEGGVPVVTVLSLAQSMNATDLTPSRMQRSVHKLRDILSRTHGNERGLVIYADTPFVAAPLTSDPEVIGQMLPELSTSLMPVLGNRLDTAIAEAHQLLTRANATRGSIIVMANDAGDDPQASVASARDAYKDGFTVSVLGAGTVDGATLQTADGRAIASQNGQTYTTALDIDALQKVALAGGGSFSTITPGGADLDNILPDSLISVAGDAQHFQADTQVDKGYLLLLVPLLLMPLLFRRGLILTIAFVSASLSFQPQDAMAESSWDNLWTTPNQQGQKAYDAGDYDSAATLFDSAEWRATSAFREGDYSTAAQSFTSSDYNRGNALAHAGQFEEALDAYEAALAANPDDEDASFNRDLIAKLVKEEEQGQDQEQQDNQQADKQQSGAEQQQSADDSSAQQQQSSDDHQQGADGSSAEQQQSVDQQQQSAEGSPADQQQAAQQRTAAGGRSPDDQQNGGEQPPAGEQQQASAEPGESESQGAANTMTETPQEIDEALEKNSLANKLAKILGKQSAEDQTERQGEPAVSANAKPLDQAIEQQLRRVPDDPSGLLRARIRQHYSRRNGA